MQIMNEQLPTAPERPFSGSLERLRAARLRPTRQRLVLARLLFDQGEARHVTAEMLHRETLAAGHKVSLATVYNTLHQFTAGGLLRQIVVDAGRTYFDTNTSEHNHYYIEDEGRLVDIGQHVFGSDSLPELPEGTKITRIDVVVRLSRKFSE